MRSVGLEPLEPYTNSGTPWRCRCTTCGHVGTPRLSYIRQLINAGTASGCASCNHKARGEQQRRAQAAQAESMMRAAGYEPLEPYDSASAPWHCRHLTCGEEVICDNYSPHLTTKRCQRVGTWAEANNVEIAYTPTNSSWLNRIEAQFTALRYFALDGTDHPTHKAQGSMIRRYIIWRNKNAADKRLKALVSRANAA
ncbi:hypothetical protein PV364_26775 [Streptomyces sp. MI02-7b]|nr:hypothetical protein [Streptomyces sp. MI02-7b]